MKEFMGEDFLLSNETAKKLYFDYAKNMPIYDYHCHLNPKDIAENKRFGSITELWLGGDHYKWRAMRANGIDEKYVTGEADDKAKFLRWAETIPYCIGNPLYHWTHLELKRYFCINDILSPETAEDIWNRCNDMLSTEQFSVRSLIERSNVKVICTTDDPADSLEYHASMKADSGFKAKVMPAFRPDNAINIEKEGFVRWISKLGHAAGMEISSLNTLMQALESRIDFFHSMGCRISDHGLEPVSYREGSGPDADAAFNKAMHNQVLTIEEIEKYKTQVMIFLGRQYAKHGWAMQLHIGALRNNSARMYGVIGPNTGYDAIADYPFAAPLSALLSRLDESDELPKTILYCLNPSGNEVLGALAGSFQSGGIPGKIQFGSGWWFNDQKDGIERQITALSNLGLLSRFVGMLTDSRSFLSYTRHEYFRRILCNMIGTWVENGEAPNDIDLLGGMVRDICCNNAENYFGI